eukprot:7771890-Pyramimonas_sp.AAC.1
MAATTDDELARDPRGRKFRMIFFASPGQYQKLCVTQLGMSENNQLRKFHTLVLAIRAASHYSIDRCSDAAHVICQSNALVEGSERYHVDL